MDYRILPPDGFLEARLRLPLSKSMSNRALIINALTPGASELENVAECDDTDAMRRALSSLDADVINIGAAGTTMRFLTAFIASRPGCSLLLDGSERMRHRPIAVLVDALRSLGADIEYAGEEGFPPLRISGRCLKGGELTLDSTVSSQYISALLMVAPLMEEGLKLTLKGETVSRPYILMTLKMMSEAGIESEFAGNSVSIAPQAYKAWNFQVEGDWSAAAAWYEIEALSSGTVTIDNLCRESFQGDRKLADIFGHLGVVTEWEGEDGGSDLVASPDQDARLRIDFSDTPDLAQYVIVTCAMLGIPFHFTGLSTLAIKETDRVKAVCTEMARLGIIMQPEGNDVLSWEGQRRPMTELPRFDTYDDHRMAMCLAPVALFVPGIIINDVEVVSKSYPEFWDELRRAGFTLLDGDAPLPDPDDE
ncbi:3-phosphoshikimate 1-carboxyvinyltransferase [Duncaniella muris]|uniref:3-phosphoshikimate 1-carboxyvinyltransferase n=1 Tax=Duncaniella muris TaxID=2094150 RepID=UPI002729D7B3|nr:3-phosphoshikimate 1-carboxyvinyltransferase [Duncaniella muris]